MFKRLTLLLVVLLTIAAGSAQQYPVQGSLAIASPYSCNLSDYANNNMQNLALNLTLTDISAANKRVRFKLFIQTQNAVIAQSTDNVQGEPVIMLDGGIPQRFTNAELAPYFRLDNLQGITSDTYARSLPEGVYTIGIEVYDYFTGNRLSGRISQTFWLIINDPPLLNTPTDKSKIADFTSASGSGGLVFNWTPRSTQVSNTEYEFALCELWDPQGDPYQQFMAAIPKYKTTVSNTSTLVYTQANPPLQSGYWYAWRVRAKAKSGFEDVGLYRNDGYSNLYTFRYGDPCPAPRNLSTEVKSHDQINLTWDAPAVSPLSSGEGSGERYKVAYRKYNLAGSNSWVETDANNTFCNLTNLEPATEYEFKVGVVCSSSPSLGGGQEEVIYTSSQRATTLEQGKIAGVECGKEPVIDISNKNLLPLLKVNDIVTAGDFPVTIFKVSGTQAGWSGEGWVRVPWLADTRIHVTFSGIQVNTDHKLIAGSFDTKYNPNGKNIADVDAAIADAKGLVTGGTDVGKVVTGADATAYTVPYAITPADIATATFTPNTTGGGTITLAEGKTIDVASVPTTVQDGAGNIYQADKDGKLSKVGSAAGNAATLVAAANLTVVDGSKGSVTFAPTNETKYAFDPWQKVYDSNGTWKAKYESLPVAGGSSYRVSSKLMVPDEADKVLALVNLKDKSLVTDSVRFVNGKGTQFEKTKITDTSFEISLVGGPAGDAQEIYALYPLNGKSYTLGKLLVASYQPRTIKLSLVPVNGTALNEDAVREQLNAIYEPLGIDFDISIEDNFDYTPLQNTPLKVEGSGLLSVYTDQMKALNNAFVASGNYEDGTVYLFVLPKGADKNGNTKGLEGDMPRGQQFGYLFADGLTDQQLALAAAHEVGHGVFQLQHTFSYSGLKQGALSSNVMDYPAGDALSKLQWDLIHDPGLVIGVFETDKGVESIATMYNYVMPNNQIFRFNNTDGAKTNDNYILVDPKNTKQYPNGTLYSFRIGDEQYDYSNGKFINQQHKEYLNQYNEQAKTSKYKFIVQSSVEPCIFYATIQNSFNGTIDLSVPAHSAYVNICDNTQGMPFNSKNKGKTFSSTDAQDIYSYLNAHLGSKYTAEAELIADFIDNMGSDKYSDYKKIALSAYGDYQDINTIDALTTFYKGLKAYSERHKNSQAVTNSNCPDCPKYPAEGDSYWDSAGRNWIFKNNKWIDLSGEFCDGSDCNNDWKQGATTEQIQYLHQQFYEKEMALHSNDPLQQALGGMPDAFRTYLLRVTQMATIRYMKERYKETKIAWWENWIPVYGHIRNAALDMQIANGDLTYQTEAIAHFAFAATDIAILKTLFEEGTYKLISNTATNVLKSSGEEWEILKFALQQNKKYLIKGSVLTLASVATQFAGNMCYYNGDVNNSIDNVDLFDAVVDGYTMEIGMTGNAIYRLFKNSNKAYIYKAGKLFLIEFSKVTIDLTKEKGLRIKDYTNTETQQKAMMLFILNLSTKYTSDQISNMLKNWSKLDLQTLYATTTTEEREMMQTIDKIVNSEKFKPLLEAPINTFNQVVSDIIENANFTTEVKKINTKKINMDFESTIKTIENLPDNTRVEILNKYRYENQ